MSSLPPPPTVRRSTAMSLLDAHRHVRRLNEGEGPFAGTLVADGDQTCVSVDVDLLHDWPGWRYAGAEHIAGPLDLVRRDDGQDVLLPWCTERVITVIGRRIAQSEPLSGGEVSTVVVSVLRGLCEVISADDDVDALTAGLGEWWFTEAGRPVLVIGDGHPLVAASEQVVLLLAEAEPDRSRRRLLERIARGLTDHRRLPHESITWEDELLALSAPRPVRRDELLPASARQVARELTEAVRPTTRRASRRDARDEGVRRARRRPRPHGRPGRFEAVLGVARSSREHITQMLRRRADAADQRRESVEETRERRGIGRDSEAGRRLRLRPLHVAAIAAGAVVLFGILWPSGGSDAVDVVGSGAEFSASAPSAAAEGGEPPTRADAVAVTETAPAVGEPPTSSADEPAVAADAPAGTDPVAAVSTLLERAGECRGGDTSACTGAWAEAPREIPALDALQSADRSLVEDYGDLAAVRLDGVGGDQAWMLIVVRLEDGWRVRDLYEIAHPPSG